MLDNLATSLGERRSTKTSRPLMGRWDNSGSISAVLCRLQSVNGVCQIKCLTVGHRFQQETENLSGAESVV